MSTMPIRSAAAKLLPGLLMIAAISGCNSDSDSSPAPAPQPPVRDTTEGPVRGVEEATMLSFKGIPYAEAPVGDLRFAPTAAPADRGEIVLDASEFGSDCAQSSAASPFVLDSMDEDCLYLNVYTPKTGSDHPVMVWIHGGAFQTGSGGASYEPSRLVAEDIVVVTINYRLGPLGFLAHPALSAEQDGASGNYGLMDQQQALRWVKTNIANFGGDARNVTIFGESAGGHSVLSHLVSPASRDLFDKVIIQSGSYAPGQRTLEEAEAAGATYASSEVINCGAAADVAACLRELPVETILSLSAPSIATGSSITPNIHPTLLPKSIGASLRDGSFKWAPVMTGNNRDEYDLFIAIEELNKFRATGDRSPRTAEAVQAALAAMLGSAENADALYPADQFASPSNRYAAAIGDYSFHCSALKQARQMSRYVPTYAYEFADRDAPNILAPFEPSFDQGAAHAVEIQYVLNSEETLRARGATDAQIALADQMVEHWTAFARSGDPNQGDAGVAWPPFVNSSQETIRRLDTADPTTLTGAQFAAAHRCAVWGADPNTL